MEAASDTLRLEFDAIKGRESENLGDVNSGSEVP